MIHIQFQGQIQFQVQKVKRLCESLSKQSNSKISRRISVLLTTKDTRKTQGTQKESAII